MKKLDWDYEYLLEPFECSGCKKLFNYLTSDEESDLFHFCMTCYNNRHGFEKTKEKIDDLNKREGYHAILWETPDKELSKEVRDQVPFWRSK